MKSGFLLIDKPRDWTSHDAVAYIRKVTGVKKIGHAGTLDPFATGLLVIGIGREATKRLDEFKALPKTYVATLKLGVISDTYDSTGNIETEGLKNLSIKFRAGKKTLDEKKVQNVLKKFIAKQKQTPPMFSAKKVKGKKLYQLARKGVEIEREPVEIEIFDIKLLDYNWPYLKIEVKCSTGTYIRSLCHDIGQVLGCGAYCDELKRTKIGKYSLSKAVDPKNLDKENWGKYLLDLTFVEK